MKPFEGALDLWKWHTAIDRKSDKISDWQCDGKPYRSCVPISPTIPMQTSYQNSMNVLAVSNSLRSEDNG